MKVVNDVRSPDSDEAATLSAPGGATKSMKIQHSNHLTKVRRRPFALLKHSEVDQ